MIAIAPPYVGTKRRRVVEEQVEVLTNMPEPRSLELGAAVTAGCSALPELLEAAGATKRCMAPAPRSDGENGSQYV